MNQTAPVKLAKYLSWVAAAVFLLLPFHAFLTIWLSSLTGHYILLRLWKEVLLAFLTAGSLYLLIKDRPLRDKLWSLALAKLIAAYLALIIICGAAALATGNVSAKAMWYGLLVDSRFLVFFLDIIIISAKSGWLELKWQKLLLGPAVLVAAFAVLQYFVLPYDFLRHFGYGSSTIGPYETINHNLAHLRVMSTLRGANPLGAYLVLPITVLAVWLFRERRERLDKAMFGFGLVLALVFSFSRSAWLGAGLSVLAAAWLSFSSKKVRKNIGWVLVIILVLGAVTTFLLRNDLGFENAVFHTDRVSTVAQSSNQGHTAAFKAAASDVLHQPLGGGVGTAGPQSVYNSGRARIAENYFLQIGQEAGVLGMVLFIAISAALGKLLYERRADPLALALFSALIGLTFVNLLSHAWEDDTLAYLFWGLAAIALTPILTDRHKQKHAKKIPAKT